MFFRANQVVLHLICCDDLMVPGWRRGTAVPTFKKVIEREESDRGLTQSLLNLLQPAASREARAAAEAAEDRDKIISVRGAYSGGFVSLMFKAQSGSPGPKPVCLFEVINHLDVTAVFVWNVTLKYTRVFLHR